MLLQSHRSRDVSTIIQDMGIKGFAYQAHQRQSQSQHVSHGPSGRTPPHCRVCGVTSYATGRH